MQRDERREISSRDKEGELTGRKGRVLIIGSNAIDHVGELSEWVEQWFREKGLGNNYEVNLLRDETYIQDAFYGRVEPWGNGTHNPPRIVLAGQYMRRYPDGFTGMYVPMESNIEEIQDLCDRHGVPLVRFEFENKDSVPVLTGGGLELLLGEGATK